MAEAFEYFNDEWNREKTTNNNINLPGMEKSISSTPTTSE